MTTGVILTYIYIFFLRREPNYLELMTKTLINNSKYKTLKNTNYFSLLCHIITLQTKNKIHLLEKHLQVVTSYVWLVLLSVL
jgi:hypothetical protein